METSEPVTITPSTYSRNSSVGSSEIFNFTLSGAAEYTITDTFDSSEATVTSSVTGDNLTVTVSVLTSGTIIGNIVVNGEATASITITVPSAMFTFSPESINEETTETHFAINMLTYPDDFVLARASVSHEGDIVTAYLDSEPYIIWITTDRPEFSTITGTVTFTYYDVDETTVLFTKTFSIRLTPPEDY